MEYCETNKQTIILAADIKFAEQLETTIKSICYHNANLHIVLLNRDFSKEWFEYLNTYLNQINCEIIDVKVNCNQLEEYKTLPHISSASTFFRYFIPAFVNDDKVLYLDCDLVVNGSLSIFFDLELNDHYVAASLDDIAFNFHQKKHFNAGVLLINNKLWREQEITLKALELTDRLNEKLEDGDQEVLNILFQNKWIELNPYSNYLVGAEYLYRRNRVTQYIRRQENDIPLILHFNTKYKPWLPIDGVPFREYYWFYYRLNWADIIARHYNIQG